ncbi:MAG: PSD1 and planctomycete cytochrome C domain-containing protein [Pirellulaceae bacterium]
MPRRLTLRPYVQRGSSKRLRLLPRCLQITISACILLGCGVQLAVAQQTGDEASSAADVSFNRDVLPILSANCYACHGFDEEARQADLRLDSAAGAAAGSDLGEPILVAGDPDASLLIKRVEATDDDIMPPMETGKSLSKEQQEILRRWVAQGGKYEKHWSFEPPQPPPVPEVVDIHGQPVTHPIDRFIQAKLKSQELAPSPIANDTTLLRRVSLDLTGLPPTLAEIDHYLAAAAIDREAAYREAVESLLNSPHYGERWGRWWLDQARYADSNGYSIDAPRQIWKFRDWVIDALNADMPFDQFTIEQLAGDLLPQATQSQRVATGFHRNTQINQEGGIDKEQFRIDSVFDRVATTGTVWLGLTVGCCQCHDHKFDPIQQREYYQLFAFFNNQDEPTLKVYGDSVSGEELRSELKGAYAALDQYIQDHLAEYEAWESKLTDAEVKKLADSAQKGLSMTRDKRSSEQMRELFAIEVGKISSDFQTLLQRAEELDNQVNGAATTLVMAERAQPRSTTVFIKGDFTRPAEEVQPGTPSVLHPLQADGELPNRLDLARWIVSADNPLTARVIVNRVWQVYFGRGIVETENDFGSLGVPPSHPQLLDWLALDFQEQQWSLKSLHRLIVTSHTYRQSSQVREDLRRIDPNNYLLGRQQRLRLDAELIRDVALSASGLLESQLGGPPVFPPIPDGVMGQGQVKRAWKVSVGADRYRRGLYTFVYRATPPPSLNVFDAPDGFSTCTRRSRSNTPLQALTLLNDSAFVEFASALQQRIEHEGIEAAFRRCTGRVPSDDELQILAGLDIKTAARVLLNLDETLTRE